MPDPISWSYAWPYFLAAFVLAYLLGSIPFGLLLTRAAGFGDIRRIGSGNIGATNVLRTGSKRLALAVLLLDVGKGAAAVLIAFLVWWGNQDTTVNTDPRRDEFVREQREWDERMRRREQWWAVGREFREVPVEGIDRLVEIEGQFALFAQSAEHLSDPDLIFLEASGETQ